MLALYFYVERYERTVYKNEKNYNFIHGFNYNITFWMFKRNFPSVRELITHIPLNEL